jgi:phosphorylated CTD-interacting factor 1
MRSDLEETSVKLNLGDPALNKTKRRDDLAKDSMTEEERDLKRRKLEERQKRFNTTSNTTTEDSSQVSDKTEKKEYRRGNNSRSSYDLDSELPTRKGKYEDKVKERKSNLDKVEMPARNSSDRRDDDSRKSNLDDGKSHLDREMPPRNPSDRRDDDFPKRKNENKNERRTVDLNFERVEKQNKISGTEDPIWDFEVANNVDEWGSVPNKEFIEPGVEYERYLQITRLRTLYTDLCKKYLSKTPPEQSFNRWLFAQLTTPMIDKKDVFLSEPDLAVECRVLRFEIQRNIPADRYIRFNSRDSVSGVTKFLSEYHKSSLDWVSRFFRLLKFSDPEDPIWKSADKNKIQTMRNRMEKLIAESQEWITANSESTTVADLMSHFNTLADALLDYQEEGLKPLVERVCAELVANGKVSIKLIQEFKVEAPQKIKFSRSGELCTLTYGEDSLKVSTTHYMKLYTLYSLHTPEDENAERFKSCLYVLLRRYQTFFGEQNEGAAMHAAALPRVFQFLKKEFDVQQENFASPFNCYFSRFNSAFPDIDMFFGSLGSFYDFKPKSGSFETGPPYTEEVMHKMAKHIEDLLGDTEEPLSFIVFVPDWRDPVSPGLEVMETSPYLRADFVLQGKSYTYVVGHQHNEIVAKRYWKIPFDTHLYVLQNEAGSQKWPATEEFIQKFKDILTK